MVVPVWLKRVLLPIWNGGHRVAWRLGEYAGAVRHGHFERCDVCGRFAPMLYQLRVVPRKLAELWGLTPRLVEALARKESSACAFCGAKLRVRRLARVLLELYPIGAPPAPARSVRDWVASEQIRRLRIAEINLIEGLHDDLARLPGHAFSDFREGGLPGTVVAGVRHEDLMALTYSDASFDLVLTSETLEHVADVRVALAEIARILVPGGRHIFTIPVLPGVERTFARCGVGPDGVLEHKATPIRHPGGDIGYPVFTEFGNDVIEIFENAGFRVAVHYGPVTEDELAQVYVCEKALARTAEGP